MIHKIELLNRIAELEGQVLWLEQRVEKLETPKKTRKVKKDEARK